MLRELYELAERKLAILGVAARYNPKRALEHADLLYDVVVQLLKSRLISAPASQALFAFRDAFFEPTDNQLR